MPGKRPSQAVVGTGPVRLLHVTECATARCPHAFIPLSIPGDIPERWRSGGGCRQSSAECGNVPLDQPGTTDDCGFAPFANDTLTARATAFA
jgi:hypothetical protein